MSFVQKKRLLLDNLPLFTRDEAALLVCTLDHKMKMEWPPRKSRYCLLQSTILLLLLFNGTVQRDRNRGKFSNQQKAYDMGLVYLVAERR